MRKLLVAFALLLPACAPRTAVVRGHEVPRPKLAYSNDGIYQLAHDAAYPEARGPSSGLHEYAGHIAGRICGKNVSLDAEYRGRYMQITGFYEPNDGARHSINQIQLEVRDYGGERHVRGTIGGGQLPVIGWAGRLFGDAPHANGRTIGDYASGDGDHEIDLSYNSGRLRGSVIGERFDLVASDDGYAGTVSVGREAREFRMSGKSDFWSLPVADQAAMVPLLLTCKVDGWRTRPANERIDLTQVYTASTPLR